MRLPFLDSIERRVRGADYARPELDEVVYRATASVRRCESRDVGLLDFQVKQAVEMISSMVYGPIDTALLEIANELLDGRKMDWDDPILVRISLIRDAIRNPKR
jgi:hypothetical protein